MKEETKMEEIIWCSKCNIKSSYWCFEFHDKYLVKKLIQKAMNKDSHTNQEAGKQSAEQAAIECGNKWGNAYNSLEDGQKWDAYMAGRKCFIAGSQWQASQPTPVKGDDKEEIRWVKACEDLPRNGNYLPIKIEGTYLTATFEGCDDGIGGIIWACYDAEGNRLDSNENRLFIEWLEDSSLRVEHWATKEDTICKPKAAPKGDDGYVVTGGHFVKAKGDVKSKEEILAIYASNYWKTITKDEKSLYHLQLNGHEALHAMEEYASQFAAPQAVKWVQASERLPEINEWYIVVVDRQIANRKIENIVTMLFYDSPNWLDQSGDGWESSQISHWMPMPKPPIEGSTDKNETNANRE